MERPRIEASLSESRKPLMLLLARMEMATLGKSFRALGDTKRRTYVENKAPIMGRIVVKKLAAFMV
jgi:hypothetical protein